MLWWTLQQLKSWNNYETRKQAVKKLVAMRSVEPLVKALNHKNSDVQRGAAEALGDIGDARAVEPLIAVVNNSFEYSAVRGEAIKALAKIGDTRAVRSLVTILKEHNISLEEVALEALGKIRDPKTVGALMVVINKSWSRTAEEALGKILEEIRHRQDVEPLVAVANATDPLMREVASGVIGEIGWEIFVTHEFHRVQERAAMELAKVGDARAVETLIKAFYHNIESLPSLDSIIEKLQLVLEADAAKIAAEDLRRVADLRDRVEIRWVDYCDGGPCRQQKSRVDCSQVRQLARQELIRRENRDKPNQGETEVEQSRWLEHKTEVEQSRRLEHKFVDGICSKCGRSQVAAEHFKWRCE